MMHEWEEYRVYRVDINEKDKYELCIEEPHGEYLDGEHVATYCIECGFLSKSYKAEDFLVKVKNGKIEPYGDYWKEFKEDLKNLNGEKNGVN